MFKKKNGIRLSYQKQGFVYFYCANYKFLPLYAKRAIRSLCDEIAGKDSTALFCFLTKPEKNAINVSMNYFTPEKKLYAYRALFYEAFWEREIFKNL